MNKQEIDYNLDWPTLDANGGTMDELPKVVRLPSLRLILAVVGTFAAFMGAYWLAIMIGA